MVSAVANDLLDGSLLDRLIQLIYDSTDGVSSKISGEFVNCAFEAIMYISQHSALFWNSFKANPDSSKLIMGLILHDTRSEVRRATMKQLSQICSYVSRCIIT